jgi:hypothetical protein
MSTRREAVIEVVALGPAPWNELAIEPATGWSATTAVNACIESVTACELVREPLAAALARVAADTERMFEGRFFTAEVELRWCRDAAGTFRAWMTREISPAAGESLSPGWLRAVVCDRRHYLLGQYDEGSVPPTFSEARYPGRRFHYPPADFTTGGEDTPRPGDRAFVVVLEYEPLPPRWETYDAAAVEAALNQPRVIAHRFVGIGYGRD